MSRSEGASWATRVAGEVEHLHREKRLRRNLAAAFPVSARRYKKMEQDSTL